ncbi:MAG: SDR family NAD(P)-dependent oxidoreductase [bacterium]|nr:short-chain dehydrogenase [Deltaproteobacteria bacterium]MCP4904644.1 SDR family NAD(P)-dependent oxidoreductase [bacterium]
MTHPFGAETSAEEAAAGIDLSDKTIVITGASAGLGVETARVLASRGARIVSVVRDEAKGRAAAEAILKSVPKARIEFAVLDLFDLDSVRRGADDIANRFPKIDRLINNAGVMACPLGRTKEGLDTQLGTNHLGHFVLTAHVMENILAGAPARIVNLSSGGHRMSPMRFDDPLFEKEDYSKFVAYGQAKTANILFSVGLDERFKDRGVRSVAVHPGAIHTELGRHMSGEDVKNLLKGRPQAEPMKFKEITQGAATTVWAATTSEFDDRGGVYCEDCGVAPVIESSDMSEGVMSWALDKEAANKLWVLSEEWSGQKFPS